MGRAPGLNIFLAYQGWRGTARAEQHLEVELSQGREHPTRSRERLGEASRDRPKGKLVWFHSGTDNEALPIPELINRLLGERRDLSFLITTARYDPALVLKDRLPAKTLHQYLPYETGSGIKAFLDHWRPDVAIWSDRDLRPRVIDAVSERKIPLFMIDAWMPDEKQHRWRWFPGTAKALLRQFDRILASDERSSANLRRLGVRPEMIEVTGFLQEGTAPLPCVQSERDALGELLAARPVWMAARVSEAEEDIVIAAHRKVMRRSHRLLLILAPDDLSRGPALGARLENDGTIVALRSREEEPEQDVQVFVADQPDELGLWYRLAPTAFLGQSLTEGPGCNPYEATALGSAVLFGPHVSGYRESYDRLCAAGAARQVQDTKSLAAAVENLLAPDLAATMAAAAWEVSTSGAEVTDRITSLIFQALDAGAE